MGPAGSSGISLSGELKLGNVYLVEERRPRASFDFFEQGLSADCCGMLVTRELPDKVVSDREIGESNVVWLTNLVGEGRVNPTAIGILMSHVRSFIEKHEKSVVLIDGLEYLISLNTYDRMLQFMNQLRDVVITNNSALIVPVDPRTLSERELALLERNLEVVVPRPTDADVQEEPLYDSQRGEIRLLDASHR
ncbi:MAG: DUF835 domain-containing protein [Methanobacteriota archaeon]|nr:MAG: DUF835 domain-containing protein [Euryarchaeota archaeon]